MDVLPGKVAAGTGKGTFFCFFAKSWLLFVCLCFSRPYRKAFFSGMSGLKNPRAILHCGRIFFSMESMYVLFSPWAKVFYLLDDNFLVIDDVDALGKSVGRIGCRSFLDEAALQVVYLHVACVLGCVDVGNAG